MSWENVLKIDDEKYPKKKPKKSTVERILEEGLENFMERRRGPQLNPKDPMSKDVIDAKENLEELAEQLKEHDESSAEFKILHRKIGQQIRNLKEQRRKQKQEEE